METPLTEAKMTLALSISELLTKQRKCWKHRWFHLQWNFNRSFSVVEGRGLAASVTLGMGSDVMIFVALWKLLNCVWRLPKRPFVEFWTNLGISNIYKRLRILVGQTEFLKSREVLGDAGFAFRSTGETGSDSGVAALRRKRSQKTWQ